MSLQNQTFARYPFKPVNGAYPHSQSTASSIVPQSYKKEFVFNASTTTPGWGQNIAITIQNLGILHSNTLIITTGPMVNGGNSSVGPASTWMDTITIESTGNKPLQQLTGLQQFTYKHTMATDLERFRYRMSEGDYSSLAARQALSLAAGGNMYIIPLADFVSQTSDYFLGCPAHALTYKFQLAALASILTPPNGSAITFPINSISMLTEITRMPLLKINERLSNMAKIREVSVFHQTSTFSTVIGINATQVTQTINLPENVVAMFTIVRPTNSQNESRFSNFMPITNYQLSNNGLPMVNTGGVIDGFLWKQYLNHFKSNITFEANTSSNIYGLTFSSDPDTALNHGCMLGSVRFTGQEILTVTLPANAQTLVLDTIIYYERNLFQGVQTNDVASTSYLA